MTLFVTKLDIYHKEHDCLIVQIFTHIHFLVILVALSLLTKKTTSSKGNDCTYYALHKRQINTESQIMKCQRIKVE